MNENAEEGFHGTAEFNSEEIGGGVYCEDATAFIEMTAGTTDWHVEFFVDEPKVNCVVSGMIATLCGEHSLTGAQLAHPATAEIVKKETGQSVLRVTEVELINLFGTCITLVFEGEVTVAPDNSAAIGSVSLSGELESAVGPVEASGILDATNPGTYGIDATRAKSIELSVVQVLRAGCL